MGLVSFASNDSCFCCLLSSGCSCLTLSSGHSWCCRRLHTWTTELRVSATVTSLKSVMCAQFVCPVSLNCLSLYYWKELQYVFFNQSVSFVFSILQLQPHLYDMRVSVSVLWSSANTSTCVHSVHLFPY